MKTFTCKELGGVCGEKFSGDSLMEIIQKGSVHMRSDKDHIEKISNMANTTNETREEWFARMQAEFDKR